MQIGPERLRLAATAHAHRGSGRVKRTVCVVAVLLSGCDCRESQGPLDASPDAARDSGAFVDAGDGSADAAPDADTGVSDERPCDIDFAPECPPEQPYCCGRGDKFVNYDCYGQPASPDETEPNVLCWHYPLEPEALPAQRCADASPCPADHPWCCTWLDWDYCSVDAMYGWDCVDLAGVPAGATGQEREDLIGRCGETQPCPDDFPYCCGNLFCSAEPLHGWACAVR